MSRKFKGVEKGDSRLTGVVHITVRRADDLAVVCPGAGLHGRGGGNTDSGVLCTDRRNRVVQDIFAVDIWASSSLDRKRGCNIHAQFTSGAHRSQFPDKLMMEQLGMAEPTFVQGLWL